MPLLPVRPPDVLLGERVAAAVSGGADSVALAWWLYGLHCRPDPPIALAGLIHVNHGLRGAESEADEAFCRALAARMRVPIDVVPAPVAAAGRSPEAEARRLRYQAFTAAAGRLDATVICTAHTADDQAETVLLRLLRGAGLRGLSGIRVVNGPVVRPLIECRRADLREALRQAGESWREDASNEDVSIPRNRVRRDLLPVVEQVGEAIAPGVIEALGRFAAHAADDERFLEAAAEALWDAVTLPSDGAGVTFARKLLVAADPALARRLVRMAAGRVAPGRAWSAVHLDAVLRLAARPEGGGRLDLPGIRVERVSNEVRLHPAS